MALALWLGTSLYGSVSEKNLCLFTIKKKKGDDQKNSISKENRINTLGQADI